jgi:hypothetical protein
LLGKFTIAPIGDESASADPRRMQDDTARVEDVLLEKDASESIVKCFVQSTGVSFEGILDP